MFTRQNFTIVGQRPSGAANTWILSLLLVLLLAMHSGTSRAGELRIAYNSEWYPYSYGEGAEVRGILVTLLDRIVGQQLGYRVAHNGYPWSRVQHYVAEGREDAFFTFPSQQRLSYADRADSDVFKVESRAFVRADSALAERLAVDPEISDIDNVRICVMLGDNWSENFYRERGLAFDYGRDTQNCLEQLAFDRTDLFIHSSASSLATLRQSGLDRQVQMLSRVYSSVPLTLLVGMKGDAPADLLARFNAEVRRMKADGSLDRLVGELLDRPWPIDAANE